MCSGSAAVKWARRALALTGRRDAHHDCSHLRFQTEEIVWCGRCGAYAEKWAVALARPCTGRPSGYGKAAHLRRLRSGRHPQTNRQLQGPTHAEHPTTPCHPPETRQATAPPPPPPTCTVEGPASAIIARLTADQPVVGSPARRRPRASGVSSPRPARDSGPPSAFRRRFPRPPAWRTYGSVPSIASAVARPTRATILTGALWGAGAMGATALLKPLDGRVRTPRGSACTRMLLRLVAATFTIIRPRP